MVLKSPSPTYWAELKRTHLQNTHTHTQSHIHTPGAQGKEEEEDAVGAAAAAANGSPRACRNVQVLRALRNARVIGASSSAPSLSPPPSSPPSSRPPPPAPPPRLGAARERNLPPPSLSLSPSPSPHPTLSPPVLSPPPSPPTHPLAGSRLSPAPPPAAARPPARSTPCGQAPARRSQGETETEGKKLQLGLRGSGLGRGSWRAGGATPKGALLSTFWASRCPVFCCNPDRERK